MTKDDGVADLHHGRFEVHGIKHVFCFCLGQRLGKELIERRNRQERGIHNFAGENSEARLQHRFGSAGCRVANGQGVVCGHHHGLLVREEIVVSHCCHACLRARGERLVHVRVLAGVGLDRQGCATIAISLAQHGVDGAALDPVVARAGIPLVVGGGFVGEVRHVEALRLQLGNGALELRDRSRNVGQFDDVGTGSLGKIAKFFECIRHPLFWSQPLREGRQDAAGERNIAGFDGHVRGRGECLHDGQKRSGGQRRSFIGVRVDNDRIGHDTEISSSGGCTHF